MDKTEMIHDLKEQIEIVECSEIVEGDELFGIVLPNMSTEKQNQIKEIIISDLKEMMLNLKSE